MPSNYSVPQVALEKNYLKTIKLQPNDAFQEPIVLFAFSFNLIPCRDSTIQGSFLVKVLSTDLEVAPTRPAHVVKYALPVGTYSTVQLFSETSYPLPIASCIIGRVHFVKGRVCPKFYDSCSYITLHRSIYGAFINTNL